ncbi:right-handed parallel beta-helix repeat-containing protein [Streptomyces sp. NPDC004065]|uniref:right-handed parallel beta-helix repeat-containing protein n=1 Tax=Streptomyces sp. NPDC004065 TaxID=3364689 RepID=UPI00384A84A6
MRGEPGRTKPAFSLPCVRPARDAPKDIRPRDRINDRRTEGEIELTLHIRGLAVAALLGATLSAITTPAVARVAAPSKEPVVPCGDVGELVRQITEGNTRGYGSIVLSSGCVYRLTAPAQPGGPDGLPVVTGNLTISGSGATILRSAATPFRIAEVAPQGTLNLNGTTVSGGSADTDNGTTGGGILTSGRLVLVNSRVTGNTATGTGGGIEVASGGTAQLTTSTVSENTASDGGGIHVSASASLNLSRSSITGNTAVSTGGGLATFGGAQLDDAVVRGNTTQNFEGGGVYAGAGTLTTTLGEISGNTAHSDGGGIANFGATLRLNDTAVRDNRAFGGGGGLYQYAGSSQLIRGGVTGNVATDAGGGILRQGGSVTLTGTSVTANQPDNCSPAGAVAGCTG